ncbi:hypothetical protein AOG23_23480 [Rhizobium acidisoli]|nr:hypothetical protein AOG23_23480 [Rhizobium acidisoli]
MRQKLQMEVASTSTDLASPIKPCVTLPCGEKRADDLVVVLKTRHNRVAGVKLLEYAPHHPGRRGKGHLIPVQALVRNSRKVFGMVEKGHCVEGAPTINTLPPASTSLPSGDASPITIAERVVGSEPVGLSGDCR